MKMRKEIFCCGCQKLVSAHLVFGLDIYPHRPDLQNLPFWKCGKCGNYVGCHHKTKNRTRPLGNIPTKELRNARKYIHAILDPLWKNGRFSRKELYGMISDKIGWKYHTANIRDIEEARTVYKIIREISVDQNKDKENGCFDNF